MRFLKERHFVVRRFYILRVLWLLLVLRTVHRQYLELFKNGCLYNGFKS